MSKMLVPRNSPRPRPRPPGPGQTPAALALRLTLAAWLAVAAAAGAEPPVQPPRCALTEAGRETVILGCPTDRSIAVSVLPVTTREVVLECRDLSGTTTVTTGPVVLTTATPTELVLDGLQADRGYQYRLRDAAPGSAAEGWTGVFHTQRPPGSTYTFVVQADPHGRDPTNTAVLYERTLLNMLADAPDFVVDLGDTFMAEKYATADVSVDTLTGEQRLNFGLLCHSAPLFLVSGNHEGEAGYNLGGGTTSLAFQAATARRRYYPNPLPGPFYGGSQGVDPLLGPRDTSYSWTWGDVLFVVLDPYRFTNRKPGQLGENWEATLGEEQYRWLARVLASSQARFKLVFAHQLVGGLGLAGRGGVTGAHLYEWGGRSSDGTWDFDSQRPGWGKPIHHLLVENQVQVFFHGHDHLYAKEDLDGVIYQELSQPSHRAPEQPVEAAAYGYTTGTVLGGSGHLRVRVTPTQLTVDYVRSCLPEDERSGRSNGQVIYSYSVSASVPATAPASASVSLGVGLQAVGVPIQPSIGRAYTVQDLAEATASPFVAWTPIGADGKRRFRTWVRGLGGEPPGVDATSGFLVCSRDGTPRQLTFAGVRWPVEAFTRQLAPGVDVISAPAGAAASWTAEDLRRAAGSPLVVRWTGGGKARLHRPGLTGQPFALEAGQGYLLTTTGGVLDLGGPATAPATTADPGSGGTTSTAVVTDTVASVIVARPGATTIDVNVLAARDLRGHVEYWAKPSGPTSRTVEQDFPGGAPIVLRISELAADTAYGYRLVSTETGRSTVTTGPAHAFHTQRAPGSPFVFEVQGDSHPERPEQNNPVLYAQTLRSVAADNPDFYFALGDDFSVDTLRERNVTTVRQVYLDHRPFFGLLAHSAPLFLVNGNHEQAALYNLDGTPDNVAVWAQNSRETLFSQPAPEGIYSGNPTPVEHIGLLRNYFAFTWGDALFVAIDPYWHSASAVDNVLGSRDRSGTTTRDLWEITLGDEQYRWLQSALESSGARFKFVFAHHVLGTGRGGIEAAGLYEWGGKNSKGEDQFAARRPGWALPIHRLMANTGVTVFFQGHDHLFAKQELDGVVYQTLPLPGDSNYALFFAEAYKSGVVLPGSGRARVSVSPQKVRVEYIRSRLAKDATPSRPDGEIAYSYEILAPAGKTGGMVLSR